MRYPIILVLATAVGLVACGKKEEATAPEQAPSAMAPAPETTTAPEAAPAAMDAATEFKSVCASCHGPSGQGVASFPKLTGLTADDVKAKLMDYKAGKQMGPQTAVMAPIAAKLSDSDIDALSPYVATLK